MESITNTKADPVVQHIPASPWGFIQNWLTHDEVIKWKHFPRYCPFVQGFDVSLICIWINGWVNNGDIGDLRRYGAHYDVTVMLLLFLALKANKIRSTLDKTF